MAATVASSTPVNAPRQPAWAAPITPFLLSANRTGPQSAVVMPSASPGRLVTIASALGRVGRPGSFHDDRIGRVNLVDADQGIGRNRKGIGHAAAVLAHPARVVGRAETSVQRGIKSLRDAALPRKEGVADGGESGKGGRFDQHRLTFWPWLNRHGSIRGSTGAGSWAIRAGIR